MVTHLPQRSLTTRPSAGPATHRHRDRRPFVACVAVSALAACGDAATPTAPLTPTRAEPASTAARQPSPGRPRGAEVQSVALAAQIPGYGGHYFDRDGNLIAYVTDTTHAAARHALAPVLGAFRYAPRGRAGQGRIVLRKGDYEFRQLGAWRDALSQEALPLEGVVLVDLDEAANRVTVGVQDDAARARVEAVAATRGVPEAAVRFQKTEPIVSDALDVSYAEQPDFDFTTLGAYNRPITAGVQIGLIAEHQPANTYTSCTIGLVARDAWLTPVLVTNSHCSYNVATLEYTSWHQPSPSAPQVAYESADPQGQIIRGYSVWNTQSVVSRQSDAALGPLTVDASQLGVGTIQGTSYTSYGPTTRGSVEVPPSRWTFRVAGEDPGTPLNVYANKMGHKGGWSYGEIINTCADARVIYDRYGGPSGASVDLRLPCQVFARYYSEGGDSGGPVFYWGGSGDEVILFGIHWGRGGSGASGYGVFSPIDQIEAELGPLYTSP